MTVKKEDKVRRDKKKMRVIKKKNALAVKRREALLNKDSGFQARKKDRAAKKAKRVLENTPTSVRDYGSGLDVQAKALGIFNDKYKTLSRKKRKLLNHKAYKAANLSSAA
jgi:hypothetical protein